MIGETAGDAVLDASLLLARGAIALEANALDDALRAAEDVSAQAEAHDELWNEARALVAAVLEERDEMEEAARVLGELRAEGRARLRVLGPPRLREMPRGARCRICRIVAIGV